MTNTIKKLPVVKGKFPWQAAFKMIKDPVNFLKKQSIETGNMYRIDAPIPFVVITGQQQIREVLINNWRKYEKGPAYNGFALMLGDGILNSEDDKWRKQRKMIQPSFNKEHVNSLTKQMISTATNMVDDWKVLAEKGTKIDAKASMIELSLDVIGEIMMGEKGSREYKGKLVPLLMNQYDFVMSQNRSFFKFPLWVPTPTHRRYYKTKEELHRLVDAIIDEKEGKEDGTLLSRIMLATDADGNSMSRPELRDEFLTLFVTGFETTGSALSWALLLLGKHPEIQEQLFEEINAPLTDGETMTAKLMGSQLLNAVVKETLRLYPSVWLIARRTKEEDVIDGMKIPKKAHVLMCSFISHRDLEYWDDVEDFKPQRWIDSPENPSYLPFGLGARMCIGNHFSHLEMIAAIHMICTRYKISLAPETELIIDPKITLQPKGEAMITIQSR